MSNKKYPLVTKGPQRLHILFRHPPKTLSCDPTTSYRSCGSHQCGRTIKERYDRPFRMARTAASSEERTRSDPLTPGSVAPFLNRLSRPFK